MHGMDVIELVPSEWALTFVIDPKNNALICFCISYEMLNPAMIKDMYPVPPMNYFPEAVSGSANILDGRR